MFSHKFICPRCLFEQGRPGQCIYCREPLVESLSPFQSISLSATVQSQREREVKLATEPFRLPSGYFELPFLRWEFKISLPSGQMHTFRWEGRRFSDPHPRLEDPSDGGWGGFGFTDPGPGSAPRETSGHRFCDRCLYSLRDGEEVRIILLADNFGVYREVVEHVDCKKERR